MPSLDGSHRLGEYFKPFIKYETLHILKYVYFFDCLNFLEVNIDEAKKVRCKLHLDCIFSDLGELDTKDIFLKEDESEQDAVVRGIQKILEALNTLKAQGYKVPLIIRDLFDWWVRTGSEFFNLYYDNSSLFQYNKEMTKLFSFLYRLGRISHCQESYLVKGFIQESLPFTYETPFVFEALSLDGIATRVSVHESLGNRAFHCSISYNEIRAEIRTVIPLDKIRILDLILETYGELYEKTQAKTVEDFGLRLAILDFESRK